MAHTGKLDHPQVEYHAVQWAMKIWSFSVMRKREMMVPTSLIVIPKSLLQKNMFKSRIWSNPWGRQTLHIVDSTCDGLVEKP